jgi:hypothetical protein
LIRIPDVTLEIVVVPVTVIVPDMGPPTVTIARVARVVGRDFIDEAQPTAAKPRTASSAGTTTCFT